MQLIYCLTSFKMKTLKCTHTHTIMMKSLLCMHENSSIWGHFRPVNLKNFFNHGVSFPLVLEILSIRGISSELWISKFSSTVEKLFTLIFEIPPSGGHFWTVSLKIFFNHCEVTLVHAWKFFDLGAFQTCEFQRLQPWSL